MFGDLNKVELMGNVTKDPDLRFTPSGAAVLSFGLATNRRYKSGEEWKDEPTFHNIVIWRNAESLAKRVKKGTRLYLEGRIQTRSWDNAEGVKQYKTEVVAENTILIARYEGGSDSEIGGGESRSSAPSSKTDEPAPEAGGEDTIDPNDLPF